MVRLTKYVSGARIDERGKASGGKAGDQGNEVNVHSLASSGSWVRILRPPKNAAKMVKAAYDIAANQHVGYDQSQRTTLYFAAKEKGWDCSKITKDVETDCSAMMAVVSCCGGIMVSKDMYTGNERGVLHNAGYKDIAYSEAALQPGDILWRPGHTVMYVGTSMTYQATPAVAPKVVARIVDVSHWNGKPDWSKIKAQGYHAIIKCGDNYFGGDCADPKFRYNASECKRLGIPFGVYYYGRAKTAAQATAEAKRCLSLIKGMKLSYPVYYDIEHSGTGPYAVTTTKAFCNAIEKAGYWAGVYTYISYWNSYMRALGGRYTKWIASYGANDGQPHAKPSIDGLDIWQYTSKGRLNGLNGDCDLNYAYRDMVKAVTGKTPENASGGSTGQSTGGSKAEIRYRVRLYGSKKWLAEVTGSKSYAGTYGNAIGYIAIKGVKRYRVKTSKGWLPWVTRYDVNDLNSGCAGDGSPIIAVQIDDTSARYAVHTIGGGWLPDMVGLKDTGGSGDTFAGNGKKVDGFRARRI